MAAQKNQDREARERLRLYQERRALHEARQRKRKRNLWIAGITAAVLIVGGITAAVIVSAKDGSNPSASPSPASPSASPSASAESRPVPDPSIAEGRTWQSQMTVNGVPLELDLDGAAAPQAVSSFLELSKEGFYDGISCHRMVNTPGTEGEPGFQILQCGDPLGNGTGGPGYTYGPIENAPADDIYPAGTLAMARTGGNAASQGSQFFLVFGNTKIPSDSAGGYTVLGKVTSGLDQLNETVTTIPVSGEAPSQPITLDSVIIK